MSFRHLPPPTKVLFKGKIQTLPRIAMMMAKLNYSFELEPALVNQRKSIKRNQKNHGRYHQGRTLEDTIALHYAIDSAAILLCAEIMFNTKEYFKCLVSRHESGQVVSNRPAKKFHQVLSLQNCYSKHISMLSNHTRMVQSQEHLYSLLKPASYRMSGEFYIK